jgi:hypothetical protein
LISSQRLEKFPVHPSFPNDDSGTGLDGGPDHLMSGQSVDKLVKTFKLYQEVISRDHLLSEVTMATAAAIAPPNGFAWLSPPP